MWALCLITLTPREKFVGLPDDLAQELNFFKEEIETGHPISGNVQLNPMPEIVKRMIKKDSTVINRLKYDAYQLPQDPRIWTFPKFKSLGNAN